MRSYEIVDWAQPLQLRVRDTPTPHGTQVLMAITHCGVCHTDLHIRDGYYDLGGGKKLTLAERGYGLPITLGHEPVGIVAAVGDQVRDVEVGQRRLINPWIGCGCCRMCLAGRDNLCPNMRSVGMGVWGGFATHLLLPSPKYLVDIEGLSAASAAPLACSGLTTYSAIRKLLPIDPLDWIAVIGCGGLGLMALAVLRGLGHERVVACDIDETKLAAARKTGVAAACNLRDDGLARLAEIAAGALYGMLDFVGSAQTFALAAPALRKGGRYVLCGLFGGAATVSTAVIAIRELSILGSVVGNTSDLVELVDLVRRGRIALPEVECRPLAAVNASLDDLAAGRVVGRVVLETTS
jgi:D-arabinose 1-dehydrogenase-like Zn-dependent alcohol dehydrogenase